jgi:hypothetical protein
LGKAVIGVVILAHNGCTGDFVAAWVRGVELLSFVGHLLKLAYRLPLDIVMLLISELLPKIQEMQTSRKLNSTATILDFLANVDLTNVLPTIPEPTPRRFMVR